MIADLIEEEAMVSSLPEVAHAMFRLMLGLLAGLNGKSQISTKRSRDMLAGM